MWITPFFLCLKVNHSGNSWAAQWLRLLVLIATGLGAISGLGTKIPRQWVLAKKKERKRKTKVNHSFKQIHIGYLLLNIQGISLRIISHFLNLLLIFLLTSVFLYKEKRISHDVLASISVGQRTLLESGDLSLNLIFPHIYQSNPAESMPLPESGGFISH